MTKDEVIAALHSIEFICEDVGEKADEDRAAFEPVITAKPDVGAECLRIWMSKYFVSFHTKGLIDKFEYQPTWDNFHLASHSLMLDRIIAAVALDGQVTSKIGECIDQTLRCGNVSQEVLTWVEFYSKTREEITEMA